MCIANYKIYYRSVNFGTLHVLLKDIKINYM